MSRPLRIEFPGAWYHVMNRGRHRENIFAETADYQSFLKLLADGSAQWNVKTSAYCLMPNHYHLLLQTPEGNLARFMRHINGVYTQRFNRSHAVDGQLFRGRYKCILVEEDAYLLQLVRYIHANPVRAALVKVLKDYNWSSHLAYTTSSKKWDWINKEKILEMFSSKKRDQKLLYLQFMGQLEEDDFCKILSRSKWPSILGAEKFKEWVKGSFFEELSNKQIPASSALAPDIATIKKLVCKAYNVDEDRMRYSRRGYFNEPRDVAMYLVRLLRNETLAEISTEFSLAGYSAVSSSIDRIRKKTDDKKLRERVLELQKQLLKGQTET